jgi:hypothetical protein
MTVFYSTELAGIASTPAVKATSGAYGARMQRFRATIALASQTTSDTIVVAVVPAGYTFAFGILTTDTSLGSTTVSVGITGSTAKYRALAVFTATATPTFFGNSATIGSATALTADETIFLTLAAATAPASGILVVDMYFSRQ